MILRRNTITQSRALKRALLGIFVSALLLAGHAAAQGFDVKAYGAKGDAASDDTAAFQQALDAARQAGGGIVTVPVGQFLIKGHLSIPEMVALEGVWRGPVSSTQTNPDVAPRTADGPTTAGLPQPLFGGSVLLAVEGAGQPEGTPFIMLSSNSTVKGLTIFYPEQTMSNPPVAYPWTIAGNGYNCSVIDMTLINPYQALDFGTRASGRHLVRNVNAQALYRGLFVDQCYDIGRVENVHFWPFWKVDLKSPAALFTLEKGEAFVIGRTDWQYISNSFSIAYGVGIRSIKSRIDPNIGAGNVLFSQTGSDMATHALIVEETQSHAGWSFVNSNLFGAIDIQPTNNGPVKFTACHFFGSVNPAQEDDIRLAGQGRVSFDNCHFFELDPAQNKTKTVIHAVGGRMSLVNCEFLSSGERAQVVLEPEVKTAVIMGNDFGAAPRIDNRAKGQVQIGLNVSATPEPAK